MLTLTRAMGAKMTPAALSRAFANNVKPSSTTPFSRMGNGVVIALAGLGVLSFGISVGVSHADRIKYENGISDQGKRITETLKGGGYHVIGWSPSEIPGELQLDGNKEMVCYATPLAAAAHIKADSCVIYPVVTGNRKAQNEAVSRRQGEVRTTPKNEKVYYNQDMHKTTVTQKGLKASLKEGGARALTDHSIEWKASNNTIERLFSSLR